jgi:glycogen debranching enzyme
MYGNVSSAAFKKYPATLCAGLPHFSTGYMRCWGRDTFISLKGIFIHNGLHQSALDTILYFASVSRHSLIPNLHDQGKNTRFNARDATWFWLQAIKDYIQATNNYECLNELVQQHFQKNN